MRLVTVAPNPSIDRLYELDRLVRDAVNRPRVETRVAGGKGLNVARAARALGAEVAAVALLAGHAGQWIAETLAAEGIDARLAWADGETRTCVAIHDGSDGTLTELNEAGPEVGPAAWAGVRRRPPDRAGDRRRRPGRDLRDSCRRVPRSTDWPSWPGWRRAPGSRSRSSGWDRPGAGVRDAAVARQAQRAEARATLGSIRSTLRPPDPAARREASVSPGSSPAGRAGPRW